MTMEGIKKWVPAHERATHHLPRLALAPVARTGGNGEKELGKMAKIELFDG